MKQVIHSENITFDHHEIKNNFKNTDADKIFYVNQLVFYPYYYFEYRLERKSLFHPNGGVVGCTIDGVNGVGAIVNTSPILDEVQLQSQTMIPAKLQINEAKPIARKFVYDTISYKMKVFSAPPIKLNRQEMIYRPYWIVEGSDLHDQNRFFLTVDAVSGKYHPL